MVGIGGRVWILYSNLCGGLRMGKLTYPTVFLPLHDDNDGRDWAAGADRPAVVRLCIGRLASEGRVGRVGCG